MKMDTGGVFGLYFLHNLMTFVTMPFMRDGAMKNRVSESKMKLQITSMRMFCNVTLHSSLYILTIASTANIDSDHAE
jgi:hypothetical protein